MTLSLSEVSQEMKKQDAYAKSLLEEGFNLKLPSDPKDFEQARSLFEAQRNSNQFKKAKFQIEETRKVYAEREANGPEPFNYWISVDYRGAGPGENFVFVQNLVRDRSVFDDHFREATDSAQDRFSRVKRSSFVDRGASKEVAEFLATEIEESGKHPIMSGVLLQIVDALVLSDNKILRSLNNGFYELPEARRKNYPVRLKIESDALVSITQLAYDPRLARNEMDVYPVLNRLVSTWGRIRANQAYKVSLDPELIVKLPRAEYVRLNKEIIPRLQSLAVEKFDRKRIHLLYSEQGPKVATDETSNVINIEVKSLNELDPLIYP